MKQQKLNIKKTKKRTGPNKLQMPDLNHHFAETSEENPSLHGFMMMVDTLSSRTQSLIELFKPQFNGNCSDKISIDDKFYTALNLKLNVEDIAAVLISAQTFEKNEKTKLPMAENCFDFLEEYIEGARSVISTLMNLFAKDEIEQESDEKILKVLNSLKLAIENINDIFKKFCKTKRMLQA